MSDHTADRQLLRDLITYARANGWTPRNRWARESKDEDRGPITWSHGPDVEIGVPGQYVGLNPPHHETFRWWMFTETMDAFPVDSVAQAVDHLIADGVLPKRFHSILRDAEQQWGALVHEPHPRRKERPGDVITVAKETALLANSIWHGWTTVTRWQTPWQADGGQP